MDFPALSSSESQSVQQKYTRDEVHQSSRPYRSTDKDNLLLFKSDSSFPSRGAIDFASAVKKMPSQDSNIWKYDRNGSTNSNIGSGRNSKVLAGTYCSGHGRGIYGDKFRSRASARSVYPLQIHISGFENHLDDIFDSADRPLQESDGG